MKRRIFNLLSIKSLITLGIVGVFLYLCLAGREIPENLDTYAGIVIAFYFGTQAEELFKSKQKEKANEQKEIADEQAQDINPLDKEY